MNKETIEIINSKKNRFSLNDLYKILSLGDVVLEKEFKTTKEALFYEIIKKLEKDGVIYSKDNTPTNNHPKFPLAQYYYKQKCVDNIEPLLVQDKLFLHSLHPKISTKKHFKDSLLLKKDKEMLIKLNEFLNHPGDDWMSIKERSYQLFNDEKLLQSSGILNRILISAKDLRCFDNPCPFLCFIGKSYWSKPKRKILVVENLDTYWTFNRMAFMEKKMTSIDMLIYGSGYFMASNNNEFTSYGVTKDDSILYFGDLDSEGFRIYQLFKKRFEEFDIQLALPLYLELIAIGEEKGYRPMPTQHLPNKEQFLDELKDLSNADKAKFIRVIDEKLFIPQEALNIALLKERPELWKL